MVTSRQLPPLIWIRAFQTAAKKGSFKEAAHQLNVSPSTISHEIRKLEDWVETPLFYRQHGGVKLTPLGVEWIEYVDEAFELLDSSMSVFKNQLFTQGLRIGALPFVTDELLLPYLAQLESLSEPYRIQFLSNIHLESLVENEKHDHLDAVIRYSAKPDDHHLWIELSYVHLAAIVSSHSESTVNLRRIQIGETADGWQKFDSLGEERVGNYHPPIKIDNYVSSLKAVERGLGIALATLPLSKNYILRNSIEYASKGRVKIPERYWFVCLKSHPHLDTLRRIALFLSERFESDRSII